MALATMKAPDGRVTVDGFYDDVKAPSRQSEELLDKVPVELEKEKQLAGLTHILGEEDLSKLKRNLFFQPVATINGLAAGYSGMGSKTIVPAEASAKMDIRLVPDQNPDEIHQKIRQHLDKRGFVDVVMDVVARMYPCRTDPESPIVKVTVDAARRVYQREPIVYPNHLGSGPMYVAVQILQRPVVAVGAAYYGSGMHSPNEHIRLDDYALATKLIASVLLEFPRAAG